MLFGEIRTEYIDPHASRLFNLIRSSPARAFQEVDETHSSIRATWRRRKKPFRVSFESTDQSALERSGSRVFPAALNPDRRIRASGSRSAPGISIHTVQQGVKKRIRVVTSSGLEEQGNIREQTRSDSSWRRPVQSFLISRG